jgi:uncharacterized protein YcgI (DUF1989 family)
MKEISLLWEETIPGGTTWSHVLKRGTSLRIVDLEGGANVAAIFYNFECPVERYNMPHQRFCVVLGHGPDSLLNNRRYGWLA